VRSAQSVRQAGNERRGGAVETPSGAGRGKEKYASQGDAARLGRTGTSYAATKSTRNDPGQLALRKYDPRVMRVVEFREHR
jgi:ribosomal protein L33